jgi:hypothetical protein
VWADPPLLEVVDVGAADADRAHLHQDFALTRSRHREVLDADVAGSVENGRAIFGHPSRASHEPSSSLTSMI